MKKTVCLLSIFIVGLLFVFASGDRMQDIKVPDLKSKTGLTRSGGGVKPDLNFGKIPLYFIANKGQVNTKAAFYAKASRYTLWLTQEGLVFDSFKRDRVEVKADAHPKFKRDVSRLHFLNTHKKPEMNPISETQLKVNYFKGNDKSKWHCDIPTSSAVLYKNLYKNIDLKVYGIEKQIEYDWIVKAGGDPGDIKVEYKNVKGSRIDEEGNLLIETDFGELMHKKPVSYQMQEAQRETVEAGFKKIAENTYGFEVEAYDSSRELIIDPVVLAYSTYLGGADQDRGTAIAVDAGGNIHVTGYTYSMDFPIFSQYQAAPDDGFIDVFVTKLDPTQNGASSLLYSTYLDGGSLDYGFGIAVDAGGNTYVTGYTSSTNFPILNQYQGNQTTRDAFVTKLDTTQSGASSLLYSTYLGGVGSDQGTAIAVDSGGHAYITGYTTSLNFPTLNQYQGAQGSQDVFVTRLDTTQSGAACLIYSTYLGGGNADRGLAIAVDAGGNAYVTGDTYSTDFPTLNQFQADQGTWDAFIVRLDTTQSGASGLIYSTYLGGGDSDIGNGIAVDAGGNAYVTGRTYSTDFPTLNQFQTNQGNVDVFVTKLDTAQSGTAGLLYSTYLGGSNNDYGYGITVDTGGNAYVTGDTDSTDFPTLNQYQAAQGNVDVFVTRLAPTQGGASSLLDSTYLGGGGSDYGHAIAIDGGGNAYVTGFSEGSDFPTLNQYQANQGLDDAFVTKLSAFSPTAPSVDSPSSAGITTTTATLGGSVSAAGGADITERGIYWSTTDGFTPPGQGTKVSETGNWGTGAFTVAVDSLPPGTSIYFIAFATNTAGTGYSSQDAFTTPASLTVSYPNGGENWKFGSTQNITWDSSGLSGNVKITLWKDGASLGIIVDNLDPAAGTYSWTVGQYTGGTAAPGTGYTVKIKEKDTTVADVSDAPFNISPSITVTSPNGGENYKLGTTQNITWNAQGVSANVKITLWKDGALVGVIANNIVPASGTYPWIVGQYDGGTVSAGIGYTVKIKEIGTTVADISNASFTISPSITVTSPNGGEDWQIGSTQNITWDAQGVSGNVKITLYKDGVFVGLVTDNLDPASGTYTWTVGNHSGGTAASGTGYTIKMKEIGTAVSDVSDAAFTLTD